LRPGSLGSRGATGSARSGGSPVGVARKRPSARCHRRGPSPSGIRLALRSDPTAVPSGRSSAPRLAIAFSDAIVALACQVRIRPPFRETFAPPPDVPFVRCREAIHLCLCGRAWIVTTKLTRSPQSALPLDSDQIGDSGPAIGYALGGRVCRLVLLRSEFSQLACCELRYHLVRVHCQFPEFRFVFVWPQNDYRKVAHNGRFVLQKSSERGLHIISHQLTAEREWNLPAYVIGWIASKFK
jgi:hypothetical protein